MAYYLYVGKMVMLLMLVLKIIIKQNDYEQNSKYSPR